MRLFLNISGPKLVYKRCLEFPVYDKILLVLLTILYVFRENFASFVDYPLRIQRKFC